MVGSSVVVRDRASDTTGVRRGGAEVAGAHQDADVTPGQSARPGATRTWTDGRI